MTAGGRRRWAEWVKRTSGPDFKAGRHSSNYSARTWAHNVLPIALPRSRMAEVIAVGVGCNRCLRMGLWRAPKNDGHRKTLPLSRDDRVADLRPLFETKEFSIGYIRQMFLPRPAFIRHAKLLRRKPGPSAQTIRRHRAPFWVREGRAQYDEEHWTLFGNRRMARFGDAFLQF